jgi:hypothetical protein
MKRELVRRSYCVSQGECFFLVGALEGSTLSLGDRAASCSLNFLLVHEVH